MVDDDGVRLEKAGNLLRLALRLADSAEGMSIDEIAAEFAVNRRTAERMRNAVRDLFPGAFDVITDGRSRRFRITGGLSDFMSVPTVAELAELDAAERALAQAGHQPRADLLRSIARKVKARFKDKQRLSLAPDIEALCRAEAIARQVGPRIATDARALDQLRRALLSMKRVRFIYLGEGGLGREHAVVPYGLLFGRYAYLVGCKVRHKEPVLWRLDRMREVEVLDTSGAPPADFDLDAYAARSFGTFQEPVSHVVLRFGPAAAEAARNTRFHATQSIAERPDGGVEISFTAGGLLEMVHHLFTWGDTVEIVAPEQLRTLMMEQLQLALRHHQGLPSPFHSKVATHW